VQDSGYISGTAAALAGVQIDSNGDQHTVPMAVNDKQLQGWSDRLSALAQTDTMPDGRPFEIIAIQHLSTKTKNFVVRIVGRADDGQTFSIDQVTKEPTEAYRHGAPILPMPAVKPPLSPQFEAIELQSRNLLASKDFYQDILHLRCELKGDRLAVDDFLIISELPETDSGSSSLTIALAVEDLAAATSGLNGLPELKYSRDSESDSLWLSDPDGNRIRIVQSKSRTTEERGDLAESAPWRIVHRRGVTYELRNATDSPKFHVRISGDGVLRTTTAKRVDGRSSLGYTHALSRRLRLHRRRPGRRRGAPAVPAALRRLGTRVGLCDLPSQQAKADGTLTLASVQVAHRTLTFPLTAELALHSSSNAR
jgi:hypothetical protein